MFINMSLIITSVNCWKCSAPTKMALTEDGEGPENFTPAEIQEASWGGVILEKRSSYTAGREYLANICGNCDAFIGSFYIFATCCSPALRGEYTYEENGVMYKRKPELYEEKPKAMTGKAEKKPQPLLSAYNCGLSQEEQQQLQEFNQKIQKLSNSRVVKG
jgi:hypothetical protein